MKSELKFLTENGVGIVITLTEIGEMFKAEATIMKAELFKQEQSNTLDFLMASGLKQLILMKEWPEMFVVEMTNFDLGKVPNEESTDDTDKIGLGLMFNGMNPMGEA